MNKYTVEVVEVYAFQLQNERFDLKGGEQLIEAARVYKCRL